MTKRMQPVRVMASPLTGNIYAVTRYRDLGDGCMEAQTKHDVTTDVRHMIAHATLSYAGAIDALREMVEIAEFTHDGERQDCPECRAVVRANAILDKIYGKG